MNSPASALPRWICAQIGAREHYAIPRALAQIGRKVEVYTDFWAKTWIRHGAIGPVRSLGTRHHPGLDQTATIHSWNFRSLMWEKRRRTRSTRQTVYHGFIDTGRAFAQSVRDSLRKRPDAIRNSIYFGYDTGALESLEWCREQGIRCIVDQMDPNRVEVEVVQAEEKLWPGWSLQALQVPAEYFARREQEWILADRIVVNSDFSRAALLQQGVPPEKLVVIPLCYEINRPATATNKLSPLTDAPLRVLFLGQVILRKGIQYLISAARLLQRENIRFDIVGPIGLSHEAIASAPGNVTFHGRAGRDETVAWYRRADVFVLPTLSDGFALTQLEAMAHGLPVVATPNCGNVVTDGIDGYLVAPRDANALANVFQNYLLQKSLLSSQSVAALAKSQQFTLNRLADNLMKLEAELRRC